jgi:3',5'-cyclic AMP phosphodiesterase CpdA
VHVSDLHLGAAGGSERQRAATAAWAEFAAGIAEDPPELVVVTGDIVVLDPDDAPDHAFAHGLLRDLGVRVRTVPGNHDVGDHPTRGGLPADWHGAPVTDGRVRQWERVWGAGHWSDTLAGRRLLGLNSQLFGTGVDAEQRQWEWLTSLAEAGAPHAPAVLFIHEPIRIPGPSTIADPWTSIPDSAVDRLCALLHRLNVQLIAAGHTHRFLKCDVEGIEQVTAPSLVAPIPVRSDMLQPPGAEAPGWVELSLGPHRIDVRHELRTHPWKQDT